MKILLVNPYIYDFTAYDLWLRPLGLLYIAAVLKNYTDVELYWLDVLDRFQPGAYPAGDKAAKKAKPDGRGKYHREAVEKPGIYREIPRKYARYGIPLGAFMEKLDKIPAVDIILVTSLMTYWIDGMKMTIDTLKRRFPSAEIVMGGILPTLVPGDILKNHLDVDYLIKGYGENKILKFIEEHGGGVYSHPDFSDIDAIPFPAFEFLSNREALPLMTSRGCPFHCTYCASDILNPGFLERCADKILEEIYFWHGTYGTRDFVIFDDALLINKQKRFLKVFQKVSEILDVRFHTPNGLHAGEIDRETAATFFKSGFKMMRLSFESICSEILSMSSDKVTVRQMAEAVENLEAAGYKRRDIDVYLLFGVPGQCVEDIEEALAFVGDLGVTPHLSYFSPVPGTVDFIELQEAGVLSTPVNLYETNKIYFVYNKSGFSVEEIKYIKDRAASLQVL
jgi:radical SAM superfamily enzyme YgiQ (UPF0313 family)